MAVREDLPYVWDQAITDENGITWSSPIDYIVTHGYTLTGGIDTSMLSEICLLRYGTNSHPLVNQCQCNRSHEVNFKSMTTSCHNLSNGSIGVMIVAGNTHGGSVNDVPDFEIYGQYITKNLITGESTVSDAGYGYVPNGRVPIAGFDLSHFALVPTIIAANAEGAQTGGLSLKEYKTSYVASYPNVVSIGYQIYFKPDLNGAYYTSTDYMLIGTPIIANTAYLDMDGSVPYNYASTTITSHRFAFMGLLYSAAYMSIQQVGIFNTHGNLYEPSLITWPYGTSSTHGPSLQKMQITDYDPGGIPLRGYCCIPAGTAEGIIKSCGLWVCDDPSTIENMSGVNTIDPGVTAPVINSQGVPTGGIDGGGSTPGQSPINQNWNTINSQFPIGNGDATGAVNINLKDPINYSSFTGQTSITPQSFENGDPELLPSNPTVSGLGVFSNYYALGSTEIQAFNSFLWQANQSVIDDIINSLKLFGQNPINAVINLRLYPFNVGALAPSINPQEIVLGRVATGVNGLLLPAGSNTVLTLGSVYIPAKYNYSPYTSYCLYIPFVGTVQLNPNTYLNHTLTLRMVVDITTGKATAIIYCEDIPMQYVDGMIGVEIPVTSENMSETVNAIIKAVGDTAAAAITTGPAAAAFTAVGGAVNVAFSGVGIDKTGNVGAAASFSMPLVPYLIISSPTTKIPGNYAHTYGHICNESGALSSFKGFTVCDNVDTSGISTATAKEREEIKSALESGVIL